MLHDIHNTEIYRRSSLKQWAILLVVVTVPTLAGADKQKTTPPQQQRGAPPPQQHSAPPQQQQRPAYQPQQQRQSTVPQQRPAYQQQQQRQSTIPQQRPTYQAPPNNNRGIVNNAATPGRFNQGSNRNPAATDTSRPGIPNTNRGVAAGSATAHPGDRTERGFNTGDPHQRGFEAGSHMDNSHAHEPGGMGRDRNPGNIHDSRVGHSFTPPRREVRDVGAHHVAVDEHHRVREIHSRDGLDIHRGLGHDRVVERHYAGGRRVVSMGPHRGFSERTYIQRNGHNYVQRTYVYGGRRYAYAYRTYYWGGRPYYRYAPAYYYHPGFYGWAYNPWPAPVYYGWGWGPSPWYGYYGYYFAPEPVYPTASLWLADFLLAENLKMAYDAQQQDTADAGAAAMPAGAAVRLSPEVKQAIAAEVQEQLKAEQQASGQPSSAPQPASSDTAPPQALDPTTTVFLVSSSLAVSTEDGQECELTAGDVLSRIDDAPGDDNAVQVRVTASKKTDCSTGTKPRVQVADLQEMHNHFREQIDAGLQTLAAGGKGLPKPPDTGTVAGEVPPPQPDDAEAQVQQLQKDGDQTEREVSQPVPAGQGGSQ